jgi:hypothetical protein
MNGLWNLIFLNSLERLRQIMKRFSELYRIMYNFALRIMYNGKEKRWAIISADRTNEPLRCVLSARSLYRCKKVNVQFTSPIYAKKKCSVDKLI